MDHRPTIRLACVNFNELQALWRFSFWNVREHFGVSELIQFQPAVIRPSSRSLWSWRAFGFFLGKHLWRFFSSGKFQPFDSFDLHRGGWQIWLTRWIALCRLYVFVCSTVFSVVCFVVCTIAVFSIGRSIVRRFLFAPKSCESKHSNQNRRISNQNIRFKTFVWKFVFAAIELFSSKESSGTGTRWVGLMES